MKLSELRERNEIRDENTMLKRLMADLSIDSVMPVYQLEVVRYLRGYR
jgi:hypothetical protein